MNEYVDQLELYLDPNNCNLKFISLNRQDKNLVINLGLKLYDKGVKDYQLWKNNEWKDRIDTLEGEKNEEIESLKNNLHLKTEQLRNLMVDQKEQIIVIKREVEEQVKLIYESKVKNNEAEREKLEEKLEVEKNKLWNMKESFYNDLSERNEKIRKEEEEKRISLRREYDALLEKEREKYMTISKRQENSTLLGQDGENFTYHKLNMLFPKSEVIDTHDEKQCGDFKLVYKNIPLLLEVKNYKGNVLKKEIIKFQRDMIFKSEMKGGIFISLKSGISSREDFQLEVYDGRPVIFLTNVKENMEKIKLAAKLIETIVKENIDLKNEEIVGGLKKLIPVIKRKWNTLKSNVENFKNKMTRDLLEQECNILEIFKLLGMKY
jgi:hypothetical protein